MIFRTALAEITLAVFSLTTITAFRSILLRWRKAASADWSCFPFTLVKKIRPHGSRLGVPWFRAIGVYPKCTPIWTILIKNNTKNHHMFHHRFKSLFITKNGVKFEPKTTKWVVLLTFCEKGNLEQTPVFTMYSHIFTPQCHQQFMKNIIIFSVI